MADSKLTALVASTVVSDTDKFYMVEDTGVAEAEYKTSAELIKSFAVKSASTTEVLTGTDTGQLVTCNALAALWEKGTNVVATTGTVTIGEGGFFHITDTGTTTVTDIDWSTATNGRVAIVEFDSSKDTLQHNATTLVLPGGKNIPTMAGDIAIFVQDSADNVHCVAYQRKDAYPGNTQIVYGNIGDTGDNTPIAASSTKYMGVGNLLADSAAKAAFPVPVSKATFRNLNVVGINPGGVGETVTCTVHNAGTAVDSSVVATIVNGSNSAQDATNTVTYDVNAGDRFSLKVVTSAGCATQTQFFFTIEMVFPVP